MPSHPPLGIDARHPGSHWRQERDGYRSRSVAPLLVACIPHQGSPWVPRGCRRAAALTTLPSVMTPSLVTLACLDEEAVAERLPHGPSVQVGVVASCRLESLPEGEELRGREVGRVLPDQRLRDLGVRALCPFDEIRMCRMVRCQRFGREDRLPRVAQLLIDDRHAARGRRWHGRRARRLNRRFGTNDRGRPRVIGRGETYCACDDSKSRRLDGRR